jgi:hypothetical protein
MAETIKPTTIHVSARTTSRFSASPAHGTDTNLLLLLPLMLTLMLMLQKGVPSSQTGRSVLNSTSCPRLSPALVSCALQTVHPLY